MFIEQFLILLKVIGEFEVEKLRISLEKVSSMQQPLFFTTDSRKIKENSVFVAIKGNNVNGHDFINVAFENGAILSIIEETGDYNGLCIKTKNSIEFINKMASSLFSDYSGYTIAITGSNGKTTTKEWVKNMLLNFQKKGSLFSNVGNMNTEIGLPLCILNNLTEQKSTSVIEMGMSNEGDIEFLVDTYKPDFPVILNIGTAHIGNTGSLENTYKEKLKILKYHINGDHFCINCSDPFLKRYLENHLTSKEPVLFGDIEDKKVGFYGVYLNKYDYSYQGQSFKTEIKMTLTDATGDKKLFRSLDGILHKGQILNLCASLAIVSSLGFDIESLSELNDYVKVVKDRFEPVFKGEHLFFKDCYNSSLESLGYALDILKQLKEDKKFEHAICVLGAISETGTYQDQIHKKIGEMLELNKIDAVYLFTKEQSIKQIEKTYKGKIYMSNNKEKIVSEIIGCIRAEKKSLFLFKASRSIQLEEVYDHVMDAVD